MASSIAEWIHTLQQRSHFLQPIVKASRLALRQIKVANKSNEIVAIPKLLICWR